MLLTENFIKKKLTTKILTTEYYFKKKKTSAKVSLYSKKNEVSLNGTDVKHTSERHFQTKKMLENSKHFPATRLQLVDLKVTLKLSEHLCIYCIEHFFVNIQRIF